MTIQVLNPAVDPGRPRRSRRARRLGNREVRFGASLLCVIALSCVLAPLFSPYAANDLVGLPFQAPSSAHLLGTDAVGRDVFTRVFTAGRLDLVVTAVAVGTSLVVGTLIGVLAGYTRRRWIDATLMRVVDGLIAFPFIILLLVLVVIIGPTRSVGPIPAGVPATLVAFAVVGWAYYARLARSQTLALREREYVVAAQVLGYSSARIILYHLAPPVFRVTSAYAVGDAIVAVIVIASMSFLGAGVAPPTPEWGNMMFEGRAVLDTAWWITVSPGVMLALTGIALSVIADGLLRGDRKPL